MDLWTVFKSETCQIRDRLFSTGSHLIFASYYKTRHFRAEYSLQIIPYLRFICVCRTTVTARWTFIITYLSRQEYMLNVCVNDQA